MPVYINGSYNNEKETIDEFETRKEALLMLKEYRTAYSNGWLIWLSQRACKSWNE